MTAPSGHSRFLLPFALNQPSSLLGSFPGRPDFARYMFFSITTQERIAREEIKRINNNY